MVRTITVYVLRTIHFLFQILFFIYDMIVYIPFKLFADPSQKLSMSQRVKVRLHHFIDLHFSFRGTVLRFLNILAALKRHRRVDHADELT